MEYIVVSLFVLPWPRESTKNIQEQTTGISTTYNASVHRHHNIIKHRLVSGAAVLMHPLFAGFPLKLVSSYIHYIVIIILHPNLICTFSIFKIDAFTVQSNLYSRNDGHKEHYRAAPDPN